MKYTLTFREIDYSILTSFLFQDRKVERGAYALCRMSNTTTEKRLLVKKIIPIVNEDVEEATEHSIKIKNRSFLRAMKDADLGKMVFVFIHSHPLGSIIHSEKDDNEEIKLFKTAYVRIKTPGVHGSIVLSSPENPVGRIWLDDSTYKPISLIRVIGERFKFYFDLGNVNASIVFFDRQIKAFGEDVQKVLQLLNVGVVGCGGTGSSVFEQLVRLGVGKITISDYQEFEETNVNRVYGSTVYDEGKKKISIAEDNSIRIGLKTQINPVGKSLTFLSAVEEFKNCDVIFGCTDDNWGRSILNKLAIYYNIPVFDMGVKIDSDGGIIKSIQGRVTTLCSNYACLICRGRINAKAIANESMRELQPEKLEELKREGYADELETTAPSVIPFTTNIASIAISEFIHRLTGFMGSDRLSNETIFRFDESKIGTNHRVSSADCFCGNDRNISRGDVEPRLDITWRPEK